MVTVNKTPEVLAIKSDKLELSKVEAFIRRLFEMRNFPDDAFNKVLLCVSEAVINSIEHGNKNNRGKRVTIVAKCKRSSLKFLVKDEGDGFDPNLVLDPTSKENIKREGGRGIFIMKSICSRLRFGDNGKCVEIKIKLK